MSKTGDWVINEMNRRRSESLIQVSIDRTSLTSRTYKGVPLPAAWGTFMYEGRYLDLRKRNISQTAMASTIPEEFRSKITDWKRNVFPSVVDRIDPLVDSQYTRPLPNIYVPDLVAGKSVADSPGYQKWLGKSTTLRSSYYRDVLHPRSFDEAFLAKSGFSYTKYEGKMQLTELFPPEKIDRAGDFTKLRAKGMPVGYGFKGQKEIPGSISGVVSKSKFSEIMALDEVRNRNIIGITRDPLSLMEGETYLGRPSLTSMSKLYMTREQGLLWGEERLGQTQYLKSAATGKPVALGSKTIMGVLGAGNALSIEQLSFREFSTELSRISKMQPTKAFTELKSIYKRGIDLPDDLLGRSPLDKKIAQSLAGGKSYARLRRAIADNRRMLKGGSLQIEMIGLQREMGIISKEALLATERDVLQGGVVRGYNAQVEKVKNLRAGTRVVLSGGTEAIVTKAESVQQLTGISAKTNRPALMKYINARYKSGLGAEAPDLFNLRLVRQPGTWRGIEQKYATRIVSEAGEHMGWVPRKYAKTFSPEVSKGLLPDKLFGRIYAERGGKDFYHKMAFFPNQEAAYSKVVKYGKMDRFSKATAFTTIMRKDWENIGEGWKAIQFAEERVAGVSGKLSKIAAGSEVGQKYITALENVDDALLAKFPRKMGRISRKPIEFFGKVPKFGKGLLIGAAITAGALMLWNANRQHRKQPLDERDIPSSMYGDVYDRPIREDLSTYTPSTRIIPENTGYRTNISIDTEDRNNIVDYKGIANTMSALSRNALGVEKASIDLHIMDDSRSMDDYNIQTKINEVLSR